MTGPGVSPDGWYVPVLGLETAQHGFWGRVKSSAQQQIIMPHIMHGNWQQMYELQ